MRLQTGDRPTLRRGRAGLLAGTALVGAALAVQTPAEEPVVEPAGTHNLFGMTGLIDMPTAEMQPDGQFTVTTGYHGQGYLRNTLSAQVLPGVEAAFRYSILDDVAGTLAQPDTLFDRSFDIKVQLVHETPDWPAVTVGLQDFLGTGVYSGEYVAATKNFLDGDLAVTGGVGWGRLAGRGTIDNPLTELSDRFRDRTRDSPTGGEVNVGQFFQGEDIGFFGGVEYHPPIEGLTLKAEYSTDTYDRERARGTYDQSMPVNFGLEYQPWKGVSLGAYYLYGADFGVRLSLSGNPYDPLAEDDAEPGPLPLTPRPLPEGTASASLLGEVREFVTGDMATVSLAGSGIAGVTIEQREGRLRWATATLPASSGYVCPDEAATAIDAEYGVIDAVTFVHADGTIVCTVALRPAAQKAVRDAVRASTDYPLGWYDDPENHTLVIEALAEQMGADRIGLFGIELEPRRVRVYFENRKFRETTRAMGRVARALARTMPSSVELFEIVPVNAGLPMAAIFLERSQLEAFAERPDADRATWLSAEVRDVEKPDWGEVRGALDQYPDFSWSIGPELPINLFDPDSPVRADLAVEARAELELRPGLSVSGAVQKRLFGGLDDIQTGSDSVLPRVRSDIARYLQEGDPAISRLTADYLTKLDDDIYARLSGGLLERMHGGVSGEVLWKRAESDWAFGVELNYTQQRAFDQLFEFQDYDVVTGHASVYWDIGIYGLSAQVDAGRYLAGDWGATFSMLRQFDNGWAFGGFFTLTDVPFEEFGEGSFDKGLILSIPLNWFLPYESRSSFTTVLRPLTRDGGQRLSVAKRLYPIVSGYDERAYKRDWGGFWQ